LIADTATITGKQLLHLKIPKSKSLTQVPMHCYSLHIEIDYLVWDRMVFLLKYLHIVNSRSIVDDNIDPDKFALHLVV
jgi:hypothetical protein